MKAIKDDYIHKIEAVKILQKAYTEGRIKAKDGCVSVLDDINALPKADVQPVKHGRWIWDSEPELGNPYGSYRCSECGNRMKFQENYCCGCGARMEDEQND